MSSIETLTELFMRFPGIGPRQARRFTYFLLREKEPYRRELIDAIAKIAESVYRCTQCQLYAAPHKQTVCAICADKNRTQAQVLIVEKDTDVEQIEKSEAYHGQYFVLGGVLSLTQSRKGAYLRERELIDYLTQHADTLQEIIIALSATPDGEYTTDHLKEKIANNAKLKAISVTILGRGLSTGSELEYADPSTLKGALSHRTRV